MINFSTLQSLTIPEGVVTQIAKDGVVLWKLETSKPIILEVEKITSDTYAGETTYTGEQFILLDIYPKTNGTVNVTYGGLTKTITDTSGAEEPNAQQVFFGTFNGVSDSVETPASGTLIIEGDCRGFGCSDYSSSSKQLNHAGVITAVSDWGNIEFIPAYAFGAAIGACTKITSLVIPDTVFDVPERICQQCTGLATIEIHKKVTSIGTYAFYGCTSLMNAIIHATIPPALGDVAFDGCENLTIFVPKGCGDAYKTATGWSTYADYITEAS